MEVFFRTPKSKLIEHVLWLVHELACRRKSEITVEVLVIGIYVGCFDALSIYWRDWQQLIRWVIANCTLEGPPWSYWGDRHSELQEDLMVSFSNEVVKIFTDTTKFATAA